MIWRYSHWKCHQQGAEWRDTNFRSLRRFGRSKSRIRQFQPLSDQGGTIEGLYIGLARLLGPLYLNVYQGKVKELSEWSQLIWSDKGACRKEWRILWCYQAWFDGVGVEVELYG